LLVVIVEPEISENDALPVRTFVPQLKLARLLTEKGLVPVPKFRFDNKLTEVSEEPSPITQFILPEIVPPDWLIEDDEELLIVIISQWKMLKLVMYYH
jgi:hypothetical protein